MDVGDTVKVLRVGLRLSGRIGVILDQHEDGRFHVSFADGDHGFFSKDELELIRTANEEK